MALDIYRKKRRFGVTPEPPGRKARGGGYRYVIHKHAARRLHYDLRLELDGVMKSWAVTRGPSLDPGEKRLAVAVEDHPVEYNSFEGTIPAGEYGGGTVMIWDCGRWIPQGDPHQGFAKGHLVFDLDGEKLRGRWHLVRMRAGRRNDQDDRRDNWLLIKGQDEEARGSGDEDILREQPLSVATGRSIEEIAAGKGEKKKRIWHSSRAADPPTPTQSAGERSAKKPASVARFLVPRQREQTRRARAATPRAPLPEFVPLSLAALYGAAPSGPDWLHEIKFDGYRMEARLDHRKVRLFTRREQDWTLRFESIAQAVAALPAVTALLDGELVVEDERGISNFSLLQTDLKEGRMDRLVYYVFDLLHLDGRDFRGEPLIARKAALKRLLRGSGAGRLRYAGHFDESGPLVLKHACAMGLEGIVSKRRNAPYRSGRSDNFVKSKCRGRAEFVVAGFTLSTAVREAIGALIVGAYEHGVLRYAGRIGTGFTQKSAHDLFRRLDPLRTARRPLALPAEERRTDVLWVKPHIVVEAEFAGVTHGGVLRQASFQGVREDKIAQEVVREIPAARTIAASPAAARAAEGRYKEGGEKIARSHFTHPDRVYWPDVGVTKADLAEYYLSVWGRMKPHLAGRPLALLRCPKGIGGHCFFQKHIPGNIRVSPLRRAVAAKEHDVIAIETRDGLLDLVQSGALEIHSRGSRLDTLEVCDRIVFDLDPGPGVSWREVVAAAREIRERLGKQKLESFAKLTGGKGVHVVVPIEGTDWDTTKAFTRSIVAAMAADSPQRYVGTMNKSARPGRIFIDYFRNSREAISIAPYSTRARPGAPVAAPVTWERLSRTTGGDDFTLRDLNRRLKSDAWADIDTVRQTLPAIGK